MKLKVYNQIKETLESLNQLKDVRKSKVLFGLLEDCRAELIKMMRKSFDSKYEFLNKEGIDVNEFISFLLETANWSAGWNLKSFISSRTESAARRFMWTATSCWNFC